MRRTTWARLDQPERLAWQAWRHVGDQVHLLQPNVEKRRDAHFVLSFDAVARWMDWHDVPKAWRARVWEGIQLLHDLRWHGERFDELRPDLCWHARAPLLLLDARRDRRAGTRRLPNCPRCARRWRCATCSKPFVLHPD